MRPAVSVVIPSTGQYALLERCVDALARQTLPFDEFEIIVAGDRESGLREARGEIVAFITEDAVPAPEWLEEGVAALARGGIGAAGDFVRREALAP